MSLKQKWKELATIEANKQVEYLKDVLGVYQKSPSNYGLLYAALFVLGTIYSSVGYWVVFGNVLLWSFVLFIHTLFHLGRVKKFKKKWGIK